MAISFSDSRESARPTSTRHFSSTTARAVRTNLVGRDCGGYGLATWSHSPSLINRSQKSGHLSDRPLITMSERLERGTDKGKSTSLAENAPLISKLFRIEIAGVENLEQIPPDKHPIYVTTHLSNYDSPIALSALSNAGVKNLKLAEAAAHERIDRNPIGYLQRRFLVGSENSFNISSIRGRTQDGTNLFNPDDFEPMIEALYKGSGIAVSAYFDPTYKDKWRGPKRGGHAAAYLPNIAQNTLIVPIAGDIQSKER